VVGVVGILDDVSKAVPRGFQRVDDAVLLLYVADRTPLTREQHHTRFLRSLGTTEFSRACLNECWGEISGLNLAGHERLDRFLADLATSRLIHSASDVGSGGLAVCLARCATARGIGADVDHIAPSIEGGVIVPSRLDALSLFMEAGAEIVVTCALEKREEIAALARTRDLAAFWIGKTVSSQLVIRAGSEPFIVLEIDELRSAHSGVLEAQLAAEVVTG